MSSEPDQKHDEERNHHNEEMYNDAFMQRMELGAEHLHMVHQGNKKKEEELEDARLQHENQLKASEQQKEHQKEATFEANLLLQHVLEGNEAQEEKEEEELEAEEHFNPSPLHHSPNPTPDSGGRHHHAKE